MRKAVNFIIAFFPCFIYFAMQFISIIIFAVIAAFININLYDNIDKYTVYILLLQGAMGITVFGLWYAAVFRNIKRQSLAELFSVKRAIAVFVMAVCIQIAVSTLIGVASFWFYDVIEEYAETMEEFIGDETFSLILYTVIAAPIAEELVFRGATLNHLKKALPFWIANIIQAVLFGVMHMNIVQGIYAFFIGLVLGIVYKKYNSLYASIALHIFINLTGFIMPKLSVIPALMYLVLVIFSFFGAVYFLSVILKKK